MNYKCSCGKTDKIKEFCSHCGRARLELIISEPVSPTSKYYCPKCLSESNYRNWCIYCSGKDEKGEYIKTPNMVKY